MHIPKAKLPFYPPCEVKCRLQNGVSTKCSRLCTKAGTHGWNSRVTRNWQATKCCTQVKHAKKLNHLLAGVLQDKKSKLAHLVSSRLELTT